MAFKVGCFYTKDSIYEDVVKNYLQKSLEKYSINAIIVSTENEKNWLKNVSKKPKIILDILNQLEDNETLVFLDADATLEKEPVLFDNIPQEYDLGFHTLDWKTWYGYNDSSTKELLTGTMFFRKRSEVLNLVSMWATVSEVSNIWEQKVLEKILDKFNLKVYNLPIEYCYIKTLPDGRSPLVKCDPVILHHQVSRIAKKIL